MFESRQSLVRFIEEFSNLINPPYIMPYITEGMLDNLENQLGCNLPVPFREFLLLLNFDGFELGTSRLGDGFSDFLDYLLNTNNDAGEYLKIGAGEIGGIFLSTLSGEVWTQYRDGDDVQQNKLANDFESFLSGYAFLQKNRIEKSLTLERAAKLVAENIGSDDYRVWLRSIV